MGEVGHDPEYWHLYVYYLFSILTDCSLKNKIANGKNAVFSNKSFTPHRILSFEHDEKKLYVNEIFILFYLN